MKTHTQAFKEKVCLFGRELDSIITYTLNGETIELGNENLNSVNPHYEGAILKSVMKQLDIDSNVEIPEGVEINYQFGIKVRTDEVEDYRDNYDYINFGNYIVYKVEKKEDTQSYQITCYDKMLYSMKDYEQMNITYPITVRNYINAICEHLGLTFKNVSGTFANYNKQIPAELYLDSQGNSLGYTFRDVLDELAQVTASTICINEEDDELEVRYITETADIIDGMYLKDVNVKFGEAIAPINTIVLSRSGGSDKVYKSYPEDLPDEYKNAIEITDNQIMNFNDRDTYLTDILNKLNGLTYYLNDFSSTGITYYNLCDRYYVQIGEDIYSCIMFNDDINITQGLEENVHTNMPEETETDYTKADKTDRRINQTYLIVDKQNQTIQSVVSNVTEQDSKISTLTQKVDSLESEISNVTGMTQTKQGLTGSVTFDDATNASEPVTIRVYPTGTSISYLYPRSNLYPSGTLYSTNRKIRFHNNTTNENIDYELPDDLLYYDSTHYDEFYLDLNSQTCQVTKKCKYNADGTVGTLSSQAVNSYTYPLIELAEGTYTVSLLGYNNGYISVTLMAKNIYTDQFYTKVETDSKISQTASSIDLSVNQKLSNYSTTDEMNSAINIKANEITSSVSETYATKSTTNSLSSRITQNAESISSEVTRATGSESSLSSRISQTAKGISLTVNNDSTSSGITIGVTKEDGTTTQTSGTIEMNGLVKFTDLSGNGTTEINGNNITTGNIKSSNYVANTSGTLINLTNGSIDTKNFKVNSTGKITSTSGVIGGWTISPSKLGGDNTYLNPNGECQFYPTGGAIVGWNNAIRLKGPSGIGIYNSHTAYGGSTTIDNGIHIMADLGNLNLMNENSSYGVNIRAYCSPSTIGNAGQRSIRLAAGANISMYAVSGYVYAQGTGVSSDKVKTDSGSASSKNVKTNIVEFKDEEYQKALNLLKNIKIYNYDYKYDLYEDRKQYGFILDEIEEVDNKFFKVSSNKAIVKGEHLDFNLDNKQEKDEIIEVKKYDSDTLDKYLLTCIKGLQNKIEKLEKEVNYGKN